MSNYSIVSTMWKNVEKEMIEETNKKFLQESYDVARFLLSTALKEYSYHNVTGNLTNSFVVAFYYERRLKGYITSAEMLGKPATRATLRKGEMYNLPEYWDGTNVKSLGKPYRGEIGSGGEYGANEAERFIYTSVGFGGWSFLIAATTEYAAYAEMKKGLNVLTSLRNGLAAAGAQVSMMKTSG